MVGNIGITQTIKGNQGEQGQKENLKPPTGMTKNMIYLEYLTVLDYFTDQYYLRWTILTDGNSEYYVYKFPPNVYAVGEVVKKAVLIRGNILPSLKNKRRYEWFSFGDVNEDLIKKYKNTDSNINAPLE